MWNILFENQVKPIQQQWTILDKIYDALSPQLTAIKNLTCSSDDQLFNSRVMISNIAVRTIASKIGWIITAGRSSQPYIVYHFSQDFQSNQYGHRKRGNFFTPSPKSTPSFIDKITLNHYLKEFRLKMEKGSFMLQDYVPIMRKISTLYSKERHLEFNRERQHLMKMIDTLGSLHPGEPSLQNFFELLDFIRVMESIDGVKKTMIYTFKDVVFLQMEGVVAQAEQLKLEMLVKLYSRMAALNHPQTSIIGKNLLERLQELEKKGQNISDIKLIEESIRNLGYRKFLSSVDKLILKQLLLNCEVKLNKLDEHMLLRIADAVSSCEVKSSIADWQINRIVDAIMAQTNFVFANEPKHSLVSFVLSKDCSSGAFLPIYQTIYKQLLERMNRREIDEQIILQFCRTVQKLQIVKFARKDCEIVLDYARWAHSKKEYREVVFKQRQLQLIIMDLIAYKYLDSSFDLLSDLIVNLPIEIYWGLISQYSIRNIAFPRIKLLMKIRSKTGQFSNDTNYLKTAVSVWVQSRFYSNERLITHCCSLITQTIRAQEWNPAKMEWLLHESIENNEIVRLYHRQLVPFFKNYNDKLCIQSGHKYINIRYLYFFAAREYSPNLVADIDLITSEVISLAAHRAADNFKPKSHFNYLLLLTIQRHLSLKKISFTEKYHNSILELLSIYSNSLIYQREEAIEMFWKVIQHLVKDTKSMHKERQFNLKALYMKLLNLSSPKLTNSLYFKNYLTSILAHFNYFSKSIEKEMIISIIRQSLQNNLLSAKILQSIELESQSLSPLERNIIEALYNHFVQEKVTFSSVLAYVSLPQKQELLPSTQTEYYNLIASESLTNLSKLLIYFNCEDKATYDEMLAKISEAFITKLSQQINESIDFIAVLSNLSLHRQVLNSDTFCTIVNKLASHLQENPDLFYLIDHLEIIQHIKKCSIDSKTYFDKLSAYISSSHDQSSKTIDILEELHASSYELSTQNLALLRQIGHKNEKKASKLLKQYEK